MTGTLNGFYAVLKKELVQMRRDTGTLRFALIIPVFQLCLFGLIDTNVRHVPLAVFDQSRTQASREFISQLEASSVYDYAISARSIDQVRAEIVAGRAQAGVVLPPEFARKILAGEPADILIMIDGSDSSVTAQTMAAANGVVFSRSLQTLLRRAGVKDPPLRLHPLILFNPDSRSANLLIPGLVAILLTFSGTLLAAFAIVRERERGTLEQLMVTPASPLAIVLGKLIPYLLLGFVQCLFVVALMVFVFRVPVHGNAFLLFALSIVYLFALLSQGLLVSSKAKTQSEAMQLAQMTLLPSIMLSGYIFPIASLPKLLQYVAQILPATHFIAISRGISIRGASFADLWPHVAALLVISVVLVTLSARAFRKTIA